MVIFISEPGLVQWQVGLAAPFVELNTVTPGNSFQDASDAT
jgi:hypothetical protein